MPLASYPMTLSEKILAHHAVGLARPYVKPGEMLCVNVQWTLACEITWKSMNQTYGEMGRPRVWRNDRFWLAVDHTVDPRINHHAKQQKMIQASEKFAKEANLQHYQKPNTTILHTDFYRQCAQPGQIIVGADSHSCSTGGIGAFAIGLGAADVVMPLVTGNTWIKVPETVKVEYVVKPAFGISGKDIMLATLGQLKCNTIAINRCVEYTGNIEHLSCDARFAISNMTTEFGGIAGIFPADAITATYLQNRKTNKDSALYFRADPTAQYAGTYPIQLHNLIPQVALFPSPDNVVPVTEVAGKPIDGCFIGACTTTEEDLILAGMVLQAGLNAGMKPKEGGKRRVTPGSLSIIDRLQSLGLLDVYKKAGFEIGAPGCSYCLAIAADVAKEGEVWLSSQNRNYRNRMGKGSIAHLSSAVTVAASSFNMEIMDPRALIDKIDQAKYQQIKEEAYPSSFSPEFVISEPMGDVQTPAPMEKTISSSPSSSPSSSSSSPLSSTLENLTGKAILFGDNIDTDAILPGEFLCENDMNALGKVAFLHTNPDFREQVLQGQSIIVAGHGFGCGSSREQAVTALKGAGVKAVISKSFGYIFSRNYQNFSLVGIPLNDDRFYSRVKENSLIEINLKARTIIVDRREIFRFEMSLFEENLLKGGGIIPLYKKYGNALFRVAISNDERKEKLVAENSTICGKTMGCHTGSADIDW